jgi:hypothetical protein
MTKHAIDYIPGCADLGDFDATSTTIALDPVHAGAVLPQDALRNTFVGYRKFFVARASGAERWEAFTPYEWRTVGALTELGMRSAADSTLDWLMQFRRPPGFRQWAEVVDSVYRRPRFIGDMPHTWVGSDYVRSVLDMLAYERESDSALVIGAGVPEAWLSSPGITVRGLRTRWGVVSFTLVRDGADVVAHVDGEGLRVPPGGIELRPPGIARGRRIRTLPIDQRWRAGARSP